LNKLKKDGYNEANEISNIDNYNQSKNTENNSNSLKEYNENNNLDKKIGRRKLILIYNNFHYRVLTNK